MRRLNFNFLARAVLLAAVFLLPAGVQGQGVEVSPTTLTVIEQATSNYTVRLTSEPSADVMVTPSTSSADSMVASVLPATALTFTATNGNWNMPQTVTVTGVSDDADRMDGSAAIGHTVTPGTATEYAAVNAADVSVTVIDNDRGITIVPDTSGTLDVYEGRSTTYTVALDTVPGGPVTVTVTSAPTQGPTVSFSTTGTSSSSLMLTFTASNWNTGQTVTVLGNEDQHPFGEQFKIRHTVSGANYYPYPTEILAPVSVNFIDNDDHAVIIEPTALVMDEINPEPASRTYTVVLNTQPTFTVTITPSSANTAVATVPTTAPMTFRALTFRANEWNIAQTVTVTPGRDHDVTTESVTITHTPSGDATYSALTVDSVKVTVNDNSTPPGIDISPTNPTVHEGTNTGTYTVRLASEPSAPVTVTPSSADTDIATVAPMRLTFIATDVNWNMPQTVSVTGVEDDDSVDEDPVNITYTAAGAMEYIGVTATVSVTVTDNDEPRVIIDSTTLDVDEGDSGTYTVRLASEPSAQVVVTPSSVNTAVAAVATDQTDNALTFTGTNWDTEQTVTVTTGAEDDDSVDGSVTIGHTVMGTAEYAGVTAAADVSVTVTDNDPRRVIVMPTALTVTEQATPTSASEYTVSLASAPTAPVTVTPSSANTAVAAVSDALTFTTAAGNWSMPQAVTVTVTADNDGMNNSVTIHNRVTQGAAGTMEYDGITAADVLVTVIEPGIDISTAALTVEEEASGTYTVRLTAEPSAAVRVTPNSADPAVATVPATVLTFTAAAGNWNTPQTVTVTGVADDDSMDEAPVNITHTVTGMAEYANVTAAAVSVTITDDDPVDDDRSLDEVNRVILPEAARALADLSTGAIARRIRQAADGVAGGGHAGLSESPARASFTFAGQSTLSGLASAHAPTLADGNLDLKQMLGASDFVMPLSAGGGGGGDWSHATLWGGGDYHHFGGEAGAVDWDGDLTNFHLGVDLRRRNQLLGVLAVYGEVDIDDYTLTDNAGVRQSGEYQMDLTSVYPYFGWRAPDGTREGWATLGYGTGNVEITPDGEGGNRPTSTGDVRTHTLGAGGSREVHRHGAFDLRLKAEGVVTNTEFQGHPDNEAARAAVLSNQEFHSSRFRVALAARRTNTLAGGAHLAPSVELGMRHDSGDGRTTGNGAEISGALHYHDATRGLTAEARGRMLLFHSGDYEDWGIGGSLRLESGADGQGLSLSLNPGYGNPAGDAQAMWRKGLLEEAVATDTDPHARLNTRIGYGLPAFALRDHLPAFSNGLLIPYSELSLGERERDYRLGVQWEWSELLDLDLFAKRDKKEHESADHSILLEVDVRF